MNERGYKKYLAIILLAVSIILLAGKSMGWFPFLQGGAQSPSKQSSSINEDNKNVNKSYSIDIPTIWKEEIDEQNKINAVINVPDSIREQGFKKANATVVKGDQANILSLFEEYYHPYRGEEDEADIQYRGKDDLYLYFPKLESYNVTASSKLREYIYMAYREQPQLEDYNRNLYYTDIDLEGFTLLDCKEKLRNIVNTLNLTEELSITYRALDYKIMEKEAYEMDMDGTVTKPDYEWSASDNSYLCTISQICNKIPIINSYALESYGDILNYGNHICLLNKERIIYLYVDEIYKIQYEDNYEEILSFSDIIDKYKRSVQLKSIDRSTNISDITMRVITVDNGNGKYQLIPVWVFYGTLNYDDGTEIPLAIFINALTGEEIE